MRAYVVIFALLTIVFGGLADQTVTHQVTLSIEIAGQPAGDIVLDLFGNVVPKTVENFVTICEGTHTADGIEHKYEGSSFHRIIPNFMIQGGDFTNHDGTGGRSVFGRSFKDENFKLKHEPFCISMANAGPDTNGSQFFITTVNTSWLDGRHVVFGKVSNGESVVKTVEKEGTNGGQPRRKVVIAKCAVRKL